MRQLLRFWRNQRGTAVIEYCVIGGLITIGLIGAISAIGSKLNVMLTPVSNNLN
jgi:pilus assembly protein Flp/PilA